MPLTLFMKSLKLAVRAWRWKISSKFCGGIFITFFCVTWKTVAVVCTTAAFLYLPVCSAFAVYLCVCCMFFFFHIAAFFLNGLHVLLMWRG